MDKYYDGENRNYKATTLLCDNKVIEKPGIQFGSHKIFSFKFCIDMCIHAVACLYKLFSYVQTFYITYISFVGKLRMKHLTD